ncbi:hypothetical protein [Catalinimonas niigatensis]|uniref:hypothetical protein n=1 Tax=Catalinimonas niigatensis TaxID=1397264 RepID=UPI0026669486|nr:hypothetical protein [Catalinimonas niigatensis]WPP51468.1 hypothetical protein PZB72_03580 [Catalinimonas niigatensis]
MQDIFPGSAMSGKSCEAFSPGFQSSAKFASLIPLARHCLAKVLSLSPWMPSLWHELAGVEMKGWGHQ